MDNKKIFDVQKNILSPQLLRVYKKNRNFIVLMPFIIDLIMAPAILLFLSYEKRVIVYLLVFPVVVSIFSYAVWHYIKRSLPQKILYRKEGIILISCNNKEKFIPWNNILEVRPLVAYGKIKVPDYMLFFRKPFPGYTPVSREVAEKIMEYMEKYKNLKIEGGDV